jgi:hypothetical protein
MRSLLRHIFLACGILGTLPAAHAQTNLRFTGRYFSGTGDIEYLQLLDIARRMFDPDPEFQNLPMLYTPAWNGLVEGPTWGAWWIQNSYGTTYCALPFLVEPMTTFLQNSQDLWFDQMGDGKTPRPFQMGGGRRFDWVPPDGCLCDAASPGTFIAKQGDGRVDIHDWGMEFTAAGVVMQAELLLVSRRPEAIAHYLPKLERCVNFIETRRDPRTNLFLAGPAGNLLAPSYAGWKRPDGKFDQAFLAGLSVTYIAALDRVIELEKLTANTDKATLYAERRELARKGLPLVQTADGCFIKSLDPDGTRHGEFGAAKHGYFEASPNHDAIAFRIVDQRQAERIYERIVSIPGLRPHAFIIPNFPSLDDMYTEPTGLWEFGRWVNGGHWSTCEARMIMAYYRLGKYEDVRKSMHQLMKFAGAFRMDNPLVKFGDDVYQPDQPINLCYDTFGPSAAMVRGLFEYLYRADGLRLIPHIPPGVTSLEQHFPIRFGKSRIYLSVAGNGPVSAVWLNDEPYRDFDAESVLLPYEAVPEAALIHIQLGKEPRPPLGVQANLGAAWPTIEPHDQKLATLVKRSARLRKFHDLLTESGVPAEYESAHARLAAECIAVIQQRRQLQAEGKLTPLPEKSQTAADQSYVDAASRLCDGLAKMLDGYGRSEDAREQQIGRLWRETAETP